MREFEIVAGITGWVPDQILNDIMKDGRLGIGGAKPEFLGGGSGGRGSDRVAMAARAQKCNKPKSLLAKQAHV